MQGAEPIYLHFMRPLIKPYVSTLDCLLDITHMLGDFVSLLIYVPISALLEWLQAMNIISTYLFRQHKHYFFHKHQTSPSWAR